MNLFASMKKTARILSHTGASFIFKDLIAFYSPYLIGASRASTVISVSLLSRPKVLWRGLLEMFSKYFAKLAGVREQSSFFFSTYIF